MVRTCAARAWPNVSGSGSPFAGLTYKGYLVIVSIGPPDLPANLAYRKGCCMDVGICSIRLECFHNRIKVAGRHILRRRSNDAPCIRRSGYSAIGWAGGSSRWPIIEVRAEEHHDAAAHVTLTEMDVGLRYRRA